MEGNGLKIVLSGPSGSGKGTIVQELIKDNNYQLSISATTRTARTGEIEGKHYFFKTQDQFQAMIEADDLLEYAEFCGNYYGTPKDFINSTIENGQDIILEIEVQGALQIKKKYPEAIFIFIMPPTFEELRTRLNGRSTDSIATIEQRLLRAREELALYNAYDYIIINDKLEDAVNEVKLITQAEKLKSERYQTYIANMLGEN
ncbi:MAG: guanylate kinase [Epulopiscium sp. Nele67-Bin005]|nr:MAG: guanylate kinase [Epulopiscium sp. Nele67-Bin005]